VYFLDKEHKQLLDEAGSLNHFFDKLMEECRTVVGCGLTSPTSNLKHTKKVTKTTSKTPNT
jgi:hypothetical protein